MPILTCAYCDNPYFTLKKPFDAIARLSKSSNWLAVSFWNITIAKESKPDVKEIRTLIDEDTKEEQVC